MTHTEQGVVMGRADYALRSEGSLVLLTPISDAAVAWFEDHLPEDRTTWGSATVVEPRYVAAIVEGLADDGLVGRSS